MNECLDSRLKQHGFLSDQVKFFIENSNTPLPENCDANFLAGQKIVVRSKNFLFSLFLISCFELSSKVHSPIEFSMNDLVNFA
ncbi:unnamed protein product [Dracunculus medinensis]|uniref:Uncharacterized protein n=1 Tax=Dracunculus medinensis TaxID=318479 RepID=A0A3P7Q0Q8_DRAME|nr:unnamed protein product [Dracunculus medinensis]